MKFILIIFLALFAIPQLFSQAKEAALNEMVKTERAFAQTSVDKGTREAFLAFIADDGILFRPTAVKGKEWMQSHPLPPAPKRQVLNWQPVFADMAQAGDMGYTTGPWQFKPDINDERPSAFGDFITVWKKQPDGSWKFAVDLGISHPEPKNTPPALQMPAQATSGSARNQLKPAAGMDLLQLELSLSKVCETRGARACFVSQLGDDVRLFRETAQPFVGPKAAAEGLTDAKWSWTTTASEVSRSGDLGYSYGTYELKTADAVSERGNYLRIWKSKSGKWKVVVDVANPLPSEKKN